MVKHVIIWKLKEMPAQEREEHKLLIKEGLESLKGRIDGLLEIKVITELLPSSSGDLMLDSAFADEKSLKAYAVHPEHVKIADERVRPFIADRKCVDFEI